MKINNIIIFFCVVIVCSSIGCGGNRASSVSGEITPVSVNASIIPESVKVEKTADGVTINYRTSVPAAKSSVVTSNFAFNNAPLWSEFHDSQSSDRVNHTVRLSKNCAAANFMIFNSPDDKYDNNGKGFKIE